MGGEEGKQMWNKAIWTKENKGKLKKKRKSIIVAGIKEKHVKNVPFSVLNS